MRILVVFAAIALCFASAEPVAQQQAQQPQPAMGAPPPPAPPPPPPPPTQQQRYCYQYTPRGGGKIESYCVGNLGECTKAHDATSHSDKYVTVSDCAQR